MFSNYGDHVIYQLGIHLIQNSLNSNHYCTRKNMCDGQLYWNRIRRVGWTKTDRYTNSESVKNLFELRTDKNCKLLIGWTDYSIWAKQEKVSSPKREIKIITKPSRSPPPNFDPFSFASSRLLPCFCSQNDNYVAPLRLLPWSSPSSAPIVAVGVKFHWRN